MASRLAPKKYGDRVSHDVQGNTTLNVQPAVLIRAGPANVSAAPEAGSSVLLDGDGDIVRGTLLLELAIEYGWAHGKNDQLSTLVDELVSAQVSVIVTLESTQGALAA